MRTNASVRPSGENAGPPSPDTAEGLVSLFFSPLSIDKRKRASGSAAESLSTMTSHLPSGDQAGAQDALAVSASLRSGPPSAGISTTAARLSLSWRRNAMERPSGDQAGRQSSAGLLVKRS